MEGFTLVLELTGWGLTSVLLVGASMSTLVGIPYIRVRGQISRKPTESSNFGVLRQNFNRSTVHFRTCPPMYPPMYPTSKS